MRELAGNSYHWMEGYSRIWTHSVTFPEKLNLPHSRDAVAVGSFGTKPEARTVSFTSILQPISALRTWGGSGTEGFLWFLIDGCDRA
jgi:hypothetical protein